MALLMSVLAVAAALLLAFIGYIMYVQREWQRRGVYTIPWRYPLLGNIGEMLLRTKAFPDIMVEMYNDVRKQNLKLGGMYMFLRPTLFVVDPDLIKELTVKHFDHFTDRRPVFQGNDKLMTRSILSLKGEEWRDIRHQLSPAFTGSKLRGMIELMDATCRHFTQYLAKRPDYKEPLDMNNALRRFAADVISTAAFGTVSDSLNNPDAPFYNNGIKLMNTSGLRGLVFAGYLTVPKLMQILKIPFVPKSLSDFFTESILGTIQYREKEQKSRPDMVQLLLDHGRKTKNYHLNDESQYDDIISQAFTFFLGGFDTIATALSFCTLLLAMHPDIQQKARDEADDAFKRGDGKIAYEDIGDLKYMDMVLSEVLRMYPPAPLVDRMCTKSFELKEHGFTVEAGETIGIPIAGLHYDPEYFPDPNKFDPERFSEENKDNIKPCTYLPFGSGPRNCVGMRFAQIEVKLCLAHLLATNYLEVSSRLQLPIKLSAKTSQLIPEGGFWLTVRPRDNPSIKV